MTNRVYILLLTTFLVIGCTSFSAAQFYYGKNKVQYTRFHWQVMKTEHFKIYFYRAEQSLAEIAANSAEKSYDFLTTKFNIEIYDRIPLIIYSNPNHFSQTNVTPYLLPENVGGFTEFIKGRVVLPFNGSYRDFDDVIRHELVHVFTIAKISRISREYGHIRIANPPLWFTEGLAEAWSRDWDSEAELIVRDMVINGTLPSIDELWRIRGTYLMYKVGESICHFIEDTYGGDILTQLFENWWVGRDFEDVVAHTLGESLEKVSEKWIYHLKKKYYPQIADLDLPDKTARRLTRRQFAVRPVPLELTNDAGEKEEWVAYKANKVGYTGIYLMPANGDDDRVITLLKGERSAKFESLHLLRSGIDVYNDSLLIFSSKSEDRDVLYLYDLNKRKVTRKYEFDSLVAISSPRFAPDGGRVVFSANRFDGYSDIYIVELAGGKLTRLTDDFYNDADPTFGFDGSSVIFSSDRGAYGFDGYMSLYRLSPGGTAPIRLTFGPYLDRGPTEIMDGQYIIFSTDRGEGGAYNLFALSRDGQLRQLTSYITGAFDPRVSQDDDNLFFTAYQNSGFHIFKAPLDLPGAMLVSTEEERTIDGTWAPGRIDASSRSGSVPYESEYSIDIAQSVVGYDAVYGTVGGLQMAMSDMLGNNTFILLLTNTARDKDEILSSFNVGLTYLHRTRRINWGFGAFHIYDEYFNDYDGYFFERQIGGVVLASYPFSKFDRIETAMYARYSDKDPLGTSRDRTAFLVTNTLSYVTDNSLWELTGPIEGRRLNISVGLTNDLKSGRTFNRFGLIDYRHYFRLGRVSALAGRLFAYSSAGHEPQRIYFGGSWSFRGYNRTDFYNRNILFNSIELRFPLLNNLVFAFPFGPISFGAIRGALFHDMGALWDDTWDKWRGSFGASMRMALGYLVVLRLDISRRHDFKTIENNTRFDFFFGWNF